MTRFGVLAVVGALACMVAAAPATLATAAGASQTYLIVYQARAVPSDAATRIASAGGTLVARYDAIGVAVARSSSDAFRSNVKADLRVAEAAATGGIGVRLNDDQATDGTTAAPNIPATTSDTLTPLQWDMAQIHTPEAHAITGGSPNIVVGDIDTGLDYAHPDLAANVDFGNSVSCVGGAPDTSPSAWNDDNGHGTHTAGTIAAASNGIGIVGVAPNVKIAGIKAGNAAGFFFPEAVVCAFMWAGSHHINVTNNSYFADPWLFNCKNDAGQRAIFAAEQRAIKYAESQGVVVVAAEGNQADDLAHPTQDATSPDDTTPVVRDITNACAVIPVEVPGVIGVTADGNLGIKSFYSSFGVGSVSVIAPGGDSILQHTAAAPNGRVLSTWPTGFGCLRLVVDAGASYCYLQGTSMASPHVAGVAALVASQHPNWSTGAITARITGTADPSACPDVAQYAFFPAVDGGVPQVCTGGTGYNSFNGHGQVNAWTAVK
ncbi:MAG TPA: S8 family serine peptidase [Candidatus Bathyarchaeia archaeon]|nr:S8 family serine peptidase [Candidatus Bathyarchaeia archaeon]